LPEYNIDTDQQTSTNNMKPDNERSHGSISLIPMKQSHKRRNAHANFILIIIIIIIIMYKT